MKRNSISSQGRLLTSLFVLGVLLLQAGGLMAADVPRIDNSADPAQGTQKVELEELWRIGGEDDEDNIFGVVNRALVDDDNNIYLLDAQLSQVSVYSTDGELIKILGKEGDGPGEFRGPVDMCFLPDGTLGVVQAFPGKVIKLNLDNTPAGMWQLGDPATGGFFIMRALKCAGGVVVAGGTQQNMDQSSGEIRRRNFVASLGEEGSLETNLSEVEHIMNMSNIKLDELVIIESPDRRFDVGQQGQTVVAIPRYGYEISIFDAKGELERVFTRKYESWKRDERAMTMWQNIFDFIQTNQVPGAEIHIEDFQPDVEFLRVAGDGSIWVLTSRAMWASPQGVFTSYDVFSPDGVYQKKLDIVCEGDPRKDFLFFAGDDLAFVVTGFWDAALSQFGGTGATDEDEEPEPMSVICYRIK